MDWLPNFVGITTNLKHVDYLKQTYTYAWQRAKDDSTKVGASIVSMDHIVATGINGFPEFLEIPPDLPKEVKYGLVRHAEKNAIDTAALLGIKTEGLTMYCPWYACSNCAISIADSGIATVIGHYEMMERTRESWIDSVVLGLNILHKKGVQALLYQGEIGGVESLMNGETWQP